MTRAARRLWAALRPFFADPLFVAGFAVRLVMVALLEPAVRREWFVPFMRHAVGRPSLDPWSSFLGEGGDPLAFPYGPVMALSYLPGVLAGTAAEWILGREGEWAVSTAFGLVTLLFDAGTLLVLRPLLGARPRTLTLFYWLSPIVLYVNYWHGQTDAVPVFFLVAGVLAVTRNAPRTAGVLLGLAVSAKYSMVLAAPPVAVYLWRSRRLRPLFAPFARALSVTLFAGTVVWFLSPGFLTTAVGSREAGKVWTLAVPLGTDRSVYVLPVAYSLLLYWGWRIGRMNKDLLLSTVGVTFFVVVLLTPASPGWYLWTVPFLVHSQLRDRPSALLGALFGVIVAATNLLFSSGPSAAGLADFTGPLLDPALFEHFHSLLLTAGTAAGLLVAARTVVHGVARDDYFRLSRSPLAVAIAGDSGTGKDTLARGIASVFGEESVTNISGDDYHKWARGAPMWKALTHLDPRANDLGRFGSDVLRVLDGTSVSCRRYDHATGTFTRAAEVAHNHVVIVSGLHALYSPAVRDRMDVKIYLAMDEDLRRYLKTRRDVGDRGAAPAVVAETIRRRADDYERHVKWQAEKADVVFTLSPLDPGDLAGSAERGAFALRVRLADDTGLDAILRVLIGVCGLAVDVTGGTADGGVDFTVEGDAAADDVALAGAELTEGMADLVGLQPAWRGGAGGVMQLVTVAAVRSALFRRARRAA